MTSPSPTTAATPGAAPKWQFQPYYGQRISDGPVKNRYGMLFVPIPGQKLGSQSMVMTIGIKGQVDDCWLSISDKHARLIEAAPTTLAALKVTASALSDLRDRFHRSLVASDTDPEFADEACSAADAAITAARSAITEAETPREAGNG